MENAVKAKGLVIYYTLGGNCRRLAEAEAERTGAEIYEMEAKKKRGFFWAVFGAIPAEMGGKPDKGLKQIDIEFDNYDEYTVIVPVFAGHPAPAFNNIIELIPKFKKVKVILSSAGGEAPQAKEKIEAVCKAKELILTDYVDEKVPSRKN